MTGKKPTLEVPPPGVGFTTVTDPVPAVLMSAALIVTVSCLSLMNWVERGLPFQFTTEFDTNPVPFTVKVNDEPPGTALAGSSGWLTNGTGLVAAVPDRLTVCVPLPALSVMVSVPLRVPVAVGLNVTAIPQFAPAAIKLPQLFVCEKLPLVATLEMVSGAVPAFESVTVEQRSSYPHLDC